MPSRSTRSASRCLLETFPVEILRRIYLYSKNPSFAVINKQISQCLSSQSVRIEFCVRVFFHGYHPPQHRDNETAKLLERARNLVLRQPWFSNSFARKLQREVLRRQNQEVRAGIRNPQTYYYDSRYARVEYPTQIPEELLLQKPWGSTKVKLVHRLFKWGATIPMSPESIARTAMMNAIVENKYLAVNLLYNYFQVPFHHEHFQAAVLGDCDKRIVEMIVESNKRQVLPFIDLFDGRIYDRAVLMQRAGNPMGRQLLTDVLWQRFERDFTLASR